MSAKLSRYSTGGNNERHYTHADDRQGEGRHRSGVRATPQQRPEGSFTSPSSLRHAADRTIEMRVRGSTRCFDLPVASHPKRARSAGSAYRSGCTRGADDPAVGKRGRMNVQTNISWPDRVARLVVGAGILGLFGALPAPWRYLTLVGLIPWARVSPDMSDVCGDRVEPAHSS